MPRKKKKYHYIYKTKCHSNDTWYIGMRSCYCKPEEDKKYFGSGKRLRYCLRKYGRKNFTKEILELCDSREELKNREREIVNEKCIVDPKCLNIQLGGGGGSLPNTISDEGRKKLSRSATKNGKRNWKNEKYRKQFIQRIKDCHKAGKYKYGLSNLGVPHTEETKRKMSIAAKKRTGKLNSQYGSFWITNGKESKKIKQGGNIPEGWKKGRTHKKIQGNFWITDGIKNKFIKKKQEIPKGWYRGMTINKHWITNGKKNKFVDNKELIPSGWRLGRII